MNKILIYLNLFISLIFAQFDLEPRMIGLSGAYTTIAGGYHSIGINPANLSTNATVGGSGLVVPSVVNFFTVIDHLR